MEGFIALASFSLAYAFIVLLGLILLLNILGLPANWVVVLLVVLGPLAGLDLSDLALRYEDLSRDMERQAEAYRQEGQAQLELGIQQRTAAYISEKAAQLGLSCRPRVETAWRDGVPYPSGVTLDIAENQALAEVLTDELGIPPSQQHWLG